MRNNSFYSISLVVVSLLLFSNLKQVYLKQYLPSERVKSPKLFTEVEAFTEEETELAAIDDESLEEETCPIKKELEELRKETPYKDKSGPLKGKQKQIQNLIIKVADETEIPAPLIQAICEVESNLNPKAFRRNDGGRRNHAIGLCQVLRKTGEMVLSMRDKGCEKDFKWIPKAARTKKACLLFDPYTNIKAAALYLKGQMRRYNTLEELIASYNAGTIRRKKSNGDFVNRRYIDKVYKALYKQHFPGELNSKESEATKLASR